ncbi:hypothetical protein [Microcoleus sp. herbarium12]|uniref:hypothetical protein n=1 Tax=Microcoleus sp. herbarium12 TaxID=3055437 RepID=UPI002FD49BBA
MQGTAWLWWQKPTSKIRLQVEVLSKITGSGQLRFLRISEYLAIGFAFLNGFDTLR